MSGARSILMLVLSGLTGCIWLTDAQLDARMDPDQDGVKGDADCAPDDATVGGASTVYLDRDGDGYGDADQSQSGCSGADDLWVLTADDCDDQDAAVNPAATEVCDAVDDDCSGDPLPCQGDLADADTILIGRAGSGTGTTFYGGTDLTGDGAADLVIGAWNDDTHGESAGAVYVVSGPLQPGTFNLETSATATYLGAEDSGAGLGVRVHAGGDFDGDGAADLAIGAHRWSPHRGNQGGVWLLTGPISPGETTLTADNAPNWVGEQGNDRAGNAVLLADLDGDALADLVIGASSFSDPIADMGRVYFILGTDEDLSGEHLLADEDPLYIDGEAQKQGLGTLMEQVGDLDGDGQPEIALQCFDDDTAGEAAGAVYLLFGLPDSVAVVSDVAVQILGREAGYGAGMSVDAAGDADGDGDEDLWIGESKADDNGANGGAVWLASGPFHPETGPVSLDDAPVLILSPTEGYEVGAEVAGGLDVNGDDSVDLVVGAVKADDAAGEVGSAWLVLGPLSGTYTYGESGATWIGTDNHAYAGRPVDTTVDLSADGSPLMLVGSVGDAQGGVDAGAVFAVAL